MLRAKTLDAPEIGLRDTKDPPLPKKNNNNVSCSFMATFGLSNQSHDMWGLSNARLYNSRDPFETSIFFTGMISDRDDHSMDQCRSRLGLSENFERHWSILISGEIHMDQPLVHTFSWGNSYGPMVLKVLLKFPPTLVLVDGWLFPV